MWLLNQSAFVFTYENFLIDRTGSCTIQFSWHTGHLKYILFGCLLRGTKKMAAITSVRTNTQRAGRKHLENLFPAHSCALRDVIKIQNDQQNNLWLLGQTILDQRGSFTRRRILLAHIIWRSPSSFGISIQHLCDCASLWLLPLFFFISLLSPIYFFFYCFCFFFFCPCEKLEEKVLRQAEYSSSYGTPQRAP